MEKRIQTAFLLIVLVQGLHSTEEYVGRLWEVFPPARYLTSLVSSDLETGFLVINVAIFVAGIFCWFFLIRHKYPISYGLIWCWIIIEMINGIGHPVWSLSIKRYTPGLITALLLLFLSIYLVRLILFTRSIGRGTASD